MLGIKLLPLSFLFQILVMFVLLFKFYSLLKKEKWQTIALQHPHYPFIPADNFLCDHPPQFVTSSFWDCRQRGEKLQMVFPPSHGPHNHHFATVHLQHLCRKPLPGQRVTVILQWSSVTPAKLGTLGSIQCTDHGNQVSRALRGKWQSKNIFH